MQEYRNVETLSQDSSSLAPPHTRGFFYKFAFLWVYRYFAAPDKPALHASLSDLLPDTARYDRGLRFAADGPVDLRRSLWSHVKWDLGRVTAIVLFKKVCDVVTVQLMYRMSVEIVEGRGDVALLVYTLPRIYALDLVGIVALAWADLLCNEIGQASRNLANCLVYQKLLTFKLLYNNMDSSESQVTNHLASDTASLTTIGENLKYLFDGGINVLTFAVWGGFYYGSSMLVLVFVFIILQILAVWIVSKVNSNQQEYLTHKDSRLKYLKSLINNLGLAKLYGLEREFFLKIGESRNKEMASMILLNVYRSWTSLFNWGSAYVGFLISLGYMFFLGQRLTYSMVVPISKMIMQLFYTTGLIPKATEGYLNMEVSLVRLQAFLDTPSIDPLFPSKRITNASHPLQLAHASFSWKPLPPPSSSELKLSPAPPVFAFRSVDLHVRRKEFVAVVGPVGAGKSSLLAALYNEMRGPTDGQKYLHEDSMYLGQRPWILNQSLRHNVVLGRDFDQARFDKALEVASLRDDVARMTAGPDTPCGKRGDKLSGGQRWRVALARAYYQQRELLVIDDPVSALDNETADHVMRELVSGELRHWSRLVVTHRKELALGAERVYLVEQGEKPREITREELEQYFSQVKQYFGQTQTVTQENQPQLTPSTLPTPNNPDCLASAPEGFSRHILLKSLRDMKSLYILILMAVLMQMASGLEPLATNFLISWSMSFTKLDRWTRLGQLGLLFLVKSIVPPVRRVVMFVHSQKHLSSAVHSRMLFKTVCADVHTFHEAQPAGLLVNRMANDLPKVDNRLCDSLGMVFNLLCVLITIVITSALAIHWISLVFLVLFALISVHMQRRIAEVRRVLTKNSSASLTPVFDHVENSLGDLTALRSLQLENQFFTKYKKLIGVHYQNSYLNAGFNIWFNTVMSLSSLLIVQIPCFVILLTREEIDWNLLVVFIVLIGNLAGDLQRFLSYLTELDSSFVDLSRCYFFDQVPLEKGLQMAPAEEAAFTSGDLHQIKRLELTLPVKPAILSIESLVASHLSAEYIPGKRVLEDVSFSLKPGWTVGIIGQSGSGKSSLLKLLWRYFDPSAGQLTINGRDVTTIEVRELRRSLSVVTQESPLLLGTLRYNVDPRHERSDTDVTLLLDELGFQKEGFNLDSEVDQDGKGLSTGERQLISLARGILSTSSIVVLDEATASLDHQLELKVRKLVTLRRRPDSIIMIVAHRIDTVKDSDWILAFNQGKLIEQGPPEGLLQNPDSYFSKMQLH